MTTHWYESHAELLAFARVLVATYDDWAAIEILHYLEKPWKWSPERDAWDAAGRPDVMASAEVTT